MIAKHIVTLCSTQRKGSIGGKSTHNKMFESFRREHNTNDAVHFRVEFEKLEILWVLDTDDKTDTWALHCVQVPVINRIIEHFKECFNNHAMSAQGHKSPLNLYVDSAFKIKLLTAM